MNEQMTIEQIGTLSAIGLGVAFVSFISVIISLYIACKALFRAYEIRKPLEKSDIEYIVLDILYENKHILSNDSHNRFCGDADRSEP